MIFDIKRLTNVAGQDFDSSKCRVRSPHITARDSIEIGDYIVAQQERIAELEKALSHAETSSTKERDIRDLEQQAKGFDYASNKLTEQQGDSAAPILEMFDYFKKDLLQQAKALKEQNK